MSFARGLLSSNMGHVLDIFFSGKEESKLTFSKTTHWMGLCCMTALRRSLKTCVTSTVACKCMRHQSLSPTL